MRTRRAFLAGLGFGAAALGLPGSARAWGGRRRRHCAPPPCETPSACCPSGAEIYAQHNTACPQYLISQVGDVYYYMCRICGSPSTCTISTSPALPGTCIPTSCTTGDVLNCCFDLGGSYDEHFRRRFTDVPNCAEVVSGTLKFPGTSGNPAQPHFIDGLNSIYAWDHLRDDIKRTTQTNGVIHNNPPVYHQLNDNRIVVLYELLCPVPWNSSTCVLRIGQHCSDFDPMAGLLGAPDLAQQFGALTGLNQVTRKNADSFYYNVAMKKPS